MTSLVTRPVTHDDVAQCIALRVDSLGSLVIGRPPPYLEYVEESEAKVHHELETAPHVHHLKVVDKANEFHVVAYAKWEFYPHGRPDLEALSEPMNPVEKEVDGYGALREAAHEYFSSRNGEMGKVPHILLALLVTASDHRGQGAGSLLVRWGIDESEHRGLPLYLQASEQGRRLYGHHGFRDIGQKEYDLTQFGLDGVEVMTEMIRQPAETQKHSQALITKDL